MLVGVLGHRRLNSRAHVADELRDVELLDEQRHLARFDLGKVENVVDESELMLCRSVNLLKIGNH